jgi:hypothetical protein
MRIEINETAKNAKFSQEIQIYSLAWHPWRSWRFGGSIHSARTSQNQDVLPS